MSENLLVMIVPADLHSNAEQLSKGFGFEENNFTVELSNSGVNPVTHYATFFVTDLEIEATIEKVGKRSKRVVAELIYEYRDATEYPLEDYFEEVLLENHLRRVVG